MNTNGIRAAIYLRVSRDDQTTDNQRLVLERVAQLGRAMIQMASVFGKQGQESPLTVYRYPPPP